MRRSLAVAGLLLITTSAVAWPDVGPVRDPATHIFVAGRKSSEIAMIDGHEDRIVGRIDLGLVADDITISASYRQLIATHLDEQSVTLFDLSAMRPMTRVALNFRPDHLQLNDETGIVAVAGADSGVVALITLDGGRIKSTVHGLARPSDLIFDRNGARLFVSSGEGSHVDIIDAANGFVSGRIKLDAGGEGIVDLARTPGGEVGVALHGTSGLISSVDLFAARQVASTRVTGPADRAFPSVNSQFFLVPNRREGTVSVISSWTYRDVQQIAIPGEVAGLHLGMFDTVAFALDSGADRAIAFNLIDDVPVPVEVPLPGRPKTGLTVDAGNKLYLALSGHGEIAVLDMRRPGLVSLIEGAVEDPSLIRMAGGLSYCH